MFQKLVENSLYFIESLFIIFNSVETKIVTWEKDSHGLFDYESKKITMQKYNVHESIKFFRISKLALYINSTQAKRKSNWSTALDRS